jgi:hypothetical protein
MRQSKRRRDKRWIKTTSKKCSSSRQKMTKIIQSHFIVVICYHGTFDNFKNSRLRNKGTA